MKPIIPMKPKSPSKTPKAGLPKPPGMVPMNSKKPVVKQTAIGRKAMKGK